MTSAGVAQARSPAGFVGDHLCWAYDNPVDFNRSAAEFLAEGLARGERVLYVASGTAEKPRRDLAPIAGIDGLIERGAALVSPVDEVHRPGALAA
jgi:hypothetical protein